MLPHFHMSGIHGLTILLYVIAAFGALHLAAISHPDNRIAQAWLALGF